MEADLVEVKAIVAQAQRRYGAEDYAGAARDLEKAAALLDADPRFSRGSLMAKVRGLRYVCEISAKGR